MQFVILAVCGMMGFILVAPTQSTQAVQSRSALAKEPAREKRWGKR